MAANMDGYTNLWPQKTVNWHLKMIGLGEHSFLGKYLPWSRGIMLTLVFFTICFQLYGIGFRIVNRQFIMAQIVIPFQFVLIVAATADETYTLIYRKVYANKCLTNLTARLNCLSYKNETAIRQKHLPLFKFLILNYVVVIYVAVMMIPVISALIRFGFDTGGASYVVYPLWYPFDVFSSRILFWATFLYETVLLCFIVHVYNTKNVMLLYVFMMTRVRFDALNQFVREVTLNDKQSESDIQGRILENNPILEKNKNNDQTGDPTGHVLMSGASSTSSSGRIFTPNSSHDNLERLKKAIEDLHMLRRHLKLINDTFKVDFGVCHSVGFTSHVISTFAMANTIRNSAGKLMDSSAEISMFAFMCIASITQIYTVCYITTLLQESYENLRDSFWETHWYAEKSEFKKLFGHTKAVLNQPLTLKAYSFYPINLVTFNSSLKVSWRVVLYLYQLTAPK